MKTCTFFGHRDCPPSVEPLLRQTVIGLIENEGVRRFMVGEQGGFDALVRRVLEQLAAQYSIQYDIVLAYLPTGCIDTAHTMMPPDLERYPKRFAIEHRNRYMLHEASHVVTYITGTYGGAFKFVERAVRLGKTVINIATAPPII